MERNLPSFITNLSGHQFEVLDELLEKKYFESVELYWLLREYIEKIMCLEYNKNKRSVSLTATVKIRGVKPEALITELQEEIPKSCHMKMEDCGKEGVRITLRKKKAKK